MSIVIRAIDTYRHGWPQCFPQVGIQTPSKEDGTFEVEDATKALALVDLNIGFEFANPEEDPTPEKRVKHEEIQEKSVSSTIASGGVQDLSAELEDELGKEAFDKLQEKANQEPTEEEKAAFVTELGTKTRAQLEELCKAFPGGEWRGKNKEALTEYLISKL